MSQFIETATGLKGRVGHSLNSHTSEIEAVRITFSSLAVVLVDAPGFDDTYRSDVEILKHIADWLKETYTKGLLLSGILYLHRISDNRTPGTPRKSFEMFKKLCGEDVYQKIVLLTTMWQDVVSDEGEQRERQLIEHDWATMIAGGSSTLRFEENTRESAWDVLNHFITRQYERQAMQIQDELVNLKKNLPNTEAGKHLYSIIEELVNEQRDVLKRLREGMEQTSDPAVMQNLVSELMQLRGKRDAAVAEMRTLDSSLVGRLRRLFRSI